MTIGGSIGLITVGAILAFAVNLSVYGLELNTIASSSWSPAPSAWSPAL